MSSVSQNLFATPLGRRGLRPTVTSVSNTVTSVSKKHSSTQSAESQDHIFPMQPFEANRDGGLSLGWDPNQNAGGEHIKEGVTTHRILGDIDLSGQVKHTDSEATLGSIKSIEDRV